MDYNQRYSNKVYILKRVNKTVIPFLFWSLFGLAFNIVILKTIQLNNLNFIYIIDGILNTKFVPIYGFFIQLFILYLTIPILSAINPEKRIKIYLYIVSLSIIIDSFLPFINNAYQLGLDYNLNLIAGGYSVIYGLIGYILSKVNLSKKQIICFLFLGIIGLLTHIVGTYIESNGINGISILYKGYFNIPCILYSIAIFILFKEISNTVFKNKYLTKIILFLKNYTFSIYLLHIYIIWLINFDSKYAINRLGLPFIIVPICILITYIIRKIPVLKKLLPE